ncbi:hypothetical protein VTL71DRAFT_2116 [Oculimacula yallundae]|uniref:HNH homing endonuclease n=1 Tax=Oculimacula yallundae TaxID=86028 RepID=A0ABR4C7Z2_9HELO
MKKRCSLQFVWQKDGIKGRGHRGFWGRLENIVTGKGPDVFVQHKGSKVPIIRDRWQNWDSYSSAQARDQEERSLVSRGLKRYDPYTRKYEEWATHHDWSSAGVDGCGIGPHNEGRTRFTKEERIKFGKLRTRGKQISGGHMGKEWTGHGLKRFGTEYNDFWQNAHQQSENLRRGLPLLGGTTITMKSSSNGLCDLER